MNKEEIFSIWAPDNSPWSSWAKPVAFAHLDVAREVVPSPEVEVDWCPTRDGKLALVLNLPGAEGVHVATALAQLGYRPVPLYNAVPLPMGIVPEGCMSVAAVDVKSIIVALKASTEAIAGSHLAPNAPPAFLLDFNRQAHGKTIERDEFDNRSVSFTTDFPSANFLAAHGIERVALVQKHDFAIQTDLAHTLRRWQEGGIKLELFRLDPLARLGSLEVPKPPWFGAMFQRALHQIGLRKSPGGGFGAWMPLPTGSGG